MGEYGDKNIYDIILEEEKAKGEEGIKERVSERLKQVEDAGNREILEMYLEILNIRVKRGITRVTVTGVSAIISFIYLVKSGNHGNLTYMGLGIFLGLFIISLRYVLKDKKKKDLVKLKMQDRVTLWDMKDILG